MRAPNTDREALQLAANLVRPAAARVASRRPAGMTHREADILGDLLRRARIALEDALRMLEKAAERRAS